MARDKIDELLKLTRENNRMLKEATTFIKKIQSFRYKEERLIHEFMTNVVADWWADYMRNGDSNNGLARKDLDELIEKLLNNK